MQSLMYILGNLKTIFPKGSEKKTSNALYNYDTEHHRIKHLRKKYTLDMYPNKLL